MRHGETEWNRTRRAQGQADVPLNDEGRAQALEAARELADLDVVAVYSSDLSRAVDTATAIADKHGLDVRTDPRLREIDQGDWEGVPVDEIKARWPELWGPARHWRARPGGESPDEVRVRALAALRDIVRRHPEGTVVVASHGGTIRWVGAVALGLDQRGSARMHGLVNGGIMSVEARVEDGRLVLENLARLDGGPTASDDPND